MVASLVLGWYWFRTAGWRAWVLAIAAGTSTGLASASKENGFLGLVVPVGLGLVWSLRPLTTLLVRLLQSLGAVVAAAGTFVCCYLPFGHPAGADRLPVPLPVPALPQRAPRRVRRPAVHPPALVGEPVVRRSRGRTGPELGDTADHAGRCRAAPGPADRLVGRLAGRAAGLPLLAGPSGAVLLLGALVPGRGGALGAGLLGAGAAGRASAAPRLVRLRQPTGTRHRRPGGGLRAGGDRDCRRSGSSIGSLVCSGTARPCSPRSAPGSGCTARC